MLSLREFQKSFGAAMRGPSDLGSSETAQLRSIVCDGGIPFERRLDVYRNNIHASLIDALTSAYPVVARLVGVDFFRAMGREFLHDHMPVCGTLIGFGDEMPEFLDRFEPVVSLPYLGDVARLERAWLLSYHAADDELLDARSLSNYAPESMSDLCFDLHPSVQTVTSSFPVWSIWQANRKAGKPGSLDLSSGGETALLLRIGHVVEVQTVTQDMATFVGALAAGAPLGDALETALDVSATFDLTQALRLLLTGGAFVNVRRSPIAG